MPTLHREQHSAGPMPALHTRAAMRQVYHMIIKEWIFVGPPIQIKLRLARAKREIFHSTFLLIIFLPCQWPPHVVPLHVVPWDQDRSLIRSLRINHNHQHKPNTEHSPTAAPLQISSKGHRAGSFYFYFYWLAANGYIMCKLPAYYSITTVEHSYKKLTKIAWPSGSQPKLFFVSLYYLYILKKLEKNTYDICMRKLT